MSIRCHIKDVNEKLDEQINLTDERPFLKKYGIMLCIIGIVLGMAIKFWLSY